MPLNRLEIAASELHTYVAEIVGQAGPVAARSTAAIELAIEACVKAMQADNVALTNPDIVDRLVNTVRRLK